MAAVSSLRRGRAHRGEDSLLRLLRTRRGTGYGTEINPLLPTSTAYLCVLDGASGLPIIDQAVIPVPLE
jgi:hypothetical protein